jgi:hypothetical protein
MPGFVLPMDQRWTSILELSGSKMLEQESMVYKNSVIYVVPVFGLGFFEQVR